MITLLTRFAPTRPYVKPVQINTFHDVSIELDAQAQGAVTYLQRLIKEELQMGLVLDALQPKAYCSHQQLLQLSVTLGSSDPESGATETLTLNPIQYAVLGQYLAQQIAHVIQHNTSRVWDVSVEVVRPQLQALLDALYTKRTRILTWTELCRIPIS